MTTPIKLSDLDCQLLTTAAGRKTASLLPTPPLVDEQALQTKKAILSLLRAKLIEEVPTKRRQAMWRQDGAQIFGLIINDDGRAALAAMSDSAHVTATIASDTIGGVAETGTQYAPTKSKLMIAMLQRPEGATLADLVQATGWLPHTTRAALTGLRKKGHAIVRDKRDDLSCYRIIAG